MHFAISVMLIMKSMEAVSEISVIKKDLILVSDLILFCIPPVLQGQMKEIQWENNDPSSLKNN